MNSYASKQDRLNVFIYDSLSPLYLLNLDQNPINILKCLILWNFSSILMGSYIGFLMYRLKNEMGIFVAANQSISMTFHVKLTA